MPELEEVRKELEPKGVHFLALSLTRNESRVRSTAAQLGVTMPVAIATGPLLGPLQTKFVPATFFVTSDGVIRASATGARSLGFLKDRAEELVGK